MCNDGAGRHEQDPVERRQPARSVRELAQALGRDDKNVHGDVAVLEAAGLLLRKGRSLSAPWSEVQATVSLGS
jgi:predicted transcriptional regulator